MLRRNLRRWIAAVAALAWLAPAGATDAGAQSPNLVANPIFTRDMPVPGWIGDHRDAWVREHPVYQATCGNTEVAREIRFLNRVIAYDEYLLSLTTSSDPDNPTVEHLASVARQSMASLRRDIVTIDALVAQLRLLPSCDEGEPAKATPVRTIPPQPLKETANATTPPPAAAAAQPAPPGDNATPSPLPATLPQPAPDKPSEPAPPGRVVIRFDDRIAALTPSGIRSFDEAVIALRRGKKLQLAIEGCEPGADFSDGSRCARRLSTLKQMLAENGIRDTKRVLAESR